MSQPRADATSRPRIVGYGEGREALLRAVISVVATSGLRQVTYRAVAAEAGVAHGLVRHHFGTRDALIEHALRYSIERSVDDAVLEPSSGELSDLGEGLARLVAENPEVQAFQYELILEARRRPELQHYIDTIYGHYREATGRALRLVGIDDDAVARLIFCTLDGLVFQQLALRNEAETNEGLATLRRILETVKSSAASSSPARATSPRRNRHSA